MTAVKMHEHEVPTSADLVRRLLAVQFPQWADLTIMPVASSGTDNALYRLGRDMVVRMPRIGWATGQIDKEATWLPKLAPFLPLAVPEQLAVGEPAHGYPWTWSVYRWIDGEGATFAALSDPGQAARDLAGFLRALEACDTAGAPHSDEHNLRGSSLALRDEATRQAITAMQGMIDAGAALRVWRAALDAPEWDRAPVWFHGDLLLGNVIVRQGRVAAVIDWSGAGVGDPSSDLMIAWSLLRGESRRVFRQALGVDDATWLRGRGRALSQAVIFVPYYLETNPEGVRNAMNMLGELLADDE